MLYRMTSQLKSIESYLQDRPPSRRGYIQTILTILLWIDNTSYFKYNILNKIIKFYYFRN